MSTKQPKTVAEKTATRKECITRDKRRIQVLLVTMLRAAKASGMSDECAEAIFNEFRHWYCQTKDGIPRGLADELRKCLVLNDVELKQHANWDD